MWQLVGERFEIRWDIRKRRINARVASPRWKARAREKCLQSGRKESPFGASPASANANLCLKINQRRELTHDAMPLMPMTYLQSLAHTHIIGHIY